MKPSQRPLETRVVAAGNRWRGAKAQERAAMSELDAVIVEAYEKGVAVRAIADRAGVSRHTVLRAIGKPPPSRRPKTTPTTTEGTDNE